MADSSVQEIIKKMKTEWSSIEGVITTMRTDAVTNIFNNFTHMTQLFNNEIIGNQKILEYIYEEYPDSKSKVEKKIKDWQKEAEIKNVESNKPKKIEKKI
jgi:hypothetical protein